MCYDTVNLLLGYDISLILHVILKLLHLEPEA